MPTQGLVYADDLANKFKNLYKKLDHSTCKSDLINEIYDENVVFKDSFHTIESSQRFKEYCSALYENLNTCNFEFHKTWLTDEDAMLTWTMHFSHPRLQGGKIISVDGASEIKFKEKIFYHQDYFDGADLLYKHIPVLGSVISFLKKRMSN